MVSTVWTLSVPSTALLHGVRFEERLGHTCALNFEYEDKETDVHVTLLFEGVEAYKCTYPFACTLEMITTAYGKVVDLESSEWLDDVRKQISSYDQDGSGLKHLRIYFDDEPCYEFICSNLRVESKVENLREHTAQAPPMNSHTRLMY